MINPDADSFVQDVVNDINNLYAKTGECLEKTKDERLAVLLMIFRTLSASIAKNVKYDSSNEKLTQTVWVLIEHLLLFVRGASPFQKHSTQ